MSIVLSPPQFYPEIPKKTVLEIEATKNRISDQYCGYTAGEYSKIFEVIKNTVLAAIPNARIFREKTEYNTGYPDYHDVKFYEFNPYIVRKKNRFFYEKIAYIDIDWGAYRSTVQIRFKLFNEADYKLVREIALKLQRLVVDRFVLIQIWCHHRKDRDDGYLGPDGALTVNGLLWCNDDWFWQSNYENYGQIRDYLKGYEVSE